MKAGTDPQKVIGERSKQAVIRDLGNRGLRDFARDLVAMPESEDREESLALVIVEAASRFMKKTHRRKNP